MRLLLSLPSTKAGFAAGMFAAGVIAISQDALLVGGAAVLAAIITPVVTFLFTHRKLMAIQVNVDGRLNESLASNQRLSEQIAALTTRIALENPRDKTAQDAAIGAQAISEVHSAP